MSHLAWSGAESTCAHDQVFVNVFSTVAGFNDRYFSLLQLVCGGLLESSVSPAWDGEQVKQGYDRFHAVTLLTIDVPILVNKVFINTRKTGWAED